MRPLLLALALAAGPAAAQDRCILPCDVVTTGEEATRRLEEILGHPLPAGATVTGLVEGGFQDAFLQVRIEVDLAGSVPILDALGVETADLAGRDALSFGPAGPDWWDAEAQDDLHVAPGTLPGFPHVTVGVRPQPDSYAIYVWAFQT